MARSTFKTFVFATLLLILGLGVAGAYQLHTWGSRKVVLPETIEFNLERGMSLRNLSQRLAQEQIISSGFAFWLRVRYLGMFPKFQAGLYRFSDSVTPNELITAFSKGDIYDPVLLEIAIPEGFTAKQIFERLVANGVGSIQNYQALFSDQTFLTNQQILSSNLEGYLYPATYRFHRKLPGPEEAILRMVKEFKQRLPEDYEANVSALGLTLNDAVKFASLIEKETLYLDEKPLVSEVIWRRLKRNEPLGIDATIIYGIENYDGNIRWKHLKDPDNLYNSRIHRGLPPTPICSPSLASLLAVLNPAQEENHFYVLIPGANGRHHFSKTLEEHNRHVKKLVDHTKSGPKPASEEKK
jgi:UPF0755 protein